MSRGAVSLVIPINSSWFVGDGCVCVLSQARLRLVEVRRITPGERKMWSFSLLSDFLWVQVSHFIFYLFFALFFALFRTFFRPLLSFISDKL